MFNRDKQKDSYTQQRERMVEHQIAPRGIQSQAVLNAMRVVPREKFIPETFQKFAYDDSPLPIDQQQTISQPYIVALMTEALQLDADSTVLEIGTGSGYAAAILAHIAERVITVERYKSLADKARNVLEGLGYNNIEVIHADGTEGWDHRAPFDGIVVTAGAPHIPKQLQAQLSIGGRLVIPVGTTETRQSLICVTRHNDDRFEEKHIAEVCFVPLVGSDGWPERTDYSKSRFAARVMGGG